MFNNKKYLLILALFSLVLILLFFQYYSSQKHGDSQSIDEVILTTTVPSSVENEFIPSELSQDSIGDEVMETISSDNAQGTFDVVRIDNNGVSVLAGKSSPNQIIKIYKDDLFIAEGLSDNQGNWVITLEDDIPNEILNLRISTTDPSKQIEVFSDQIVTIMPNKIVDKVENFSSDENIVLLTQEDKASQILSDDPSFLQDETMVDIRSIDYSEEKLVLGGNAEANKEVNAYIDNKYVGSVISNNLGKWTLNIDENIVPGEYEIRADMVDDQRFVIARTSTKFTRLFDDIDGNFGLNTITIEPGDNLWNISRTKYGTGMQYTVIYLANSNQIVDPDLIFPGQVLMVPGS
tara:strand:+ start:3686 stop:4732 length:1047 start_codon:yes stop_codon:yes gene_type:complete